MVFRLTPRNFLLILFFLYLQLLLQALERGLCSLGRQRDKARVLGSFWHMKELLQ